ncbi:MAG: hypothetical protein ABTQ73_07510 [Caldilineales bacterium]
MEIALVLLFIIGLMGVYILYLTVRLSLSSRTTMVVMAPTPAGEQGNGCGVAVFLILTIIAAIILTLVFGPIFLG